MAKLSKIANTKPIALSFDGVYIKNLPAKVIEEQFGDIESKLAENPEAVIVSLFTDLICDEAGEAFEDCGTFGEITAVLSITDIHGIISAIPEALSPSATNSGK